jgi:site-specific DNA recombinase
MRLDAYVRVSRVRGRSGDSYIAEDVQEGRIRDYVRAYPQHEIIRWHVERDESGKSAKRPLFNEMLRRVENGETDGVIVARVDRFARSVTVAYDALARIKAKEGAAFIVVDPPLDTSTDHGKFALTMMLAIAELEVDRITANWLDARQKAISRGVHIASRCPTGYRRDGKSQPLLLDEATAPVIAEVFRQRAAGASLSQLSALLGERGVIGPYGSPRWTISAVQKIIRNPVYTGEARHGTLVQKDAHPAIVTRAEWRAAQRVRAVSAARSAEGALLSGLLRCAGCRYVMKPEHMKDEKGNRLRIYTCRNDYAAGKCPAPTAVLGRVIEPHVVAAFFEEQGSEDVLAKASAAADELAAAQSELADAELELDAFLATDVRSQSERAFSRGVAIREERIERAEAEVGRLQAAATALPGDLKTLRQEWEHFSNDDRRWILSQAIEAIFLRRGRNVPIADRSLVIWRGGVPLDLPRRGRRLPLASFEWPDDAPTSTGVAAL